MQLWDFRATEAYGTPTPHTQTQVNKKRIRNKILNSSKNYKGTRRKPTMKMLLK